MKLGKIIKGDALEVLRTLPAGSVQCVVTSPPFWGLRDYRVDGESLAGQYGQEATPEEHVAVMVAVFRDLRQVLRHDGTLWLNYGDSYSHGGNGSRDPKRWPKQSRNAHRVEHSKKNGVGLKPKDLVGMPWRVAFALQADGWWLRSDIVWAKKNPMPESVTDRPTHSHEYLFLLSKRARYFYDAEAVREASNTGDMRRPYAPGQVDNRGNGHDREGGTLRKMPDGWDTGLGAHGTIDREGREKGRKTEAPEAAGRNLRSVWHIATQPYPGAHYATFPEALVEPCIKAGSSEKGACPACGAAWARVVDKPAIGDWNPGPGSNGPGKINAQKADRKGREFYRTESAYEAGSTAHRLALLRQQARANGGEYANAARTIDWCPTCACGAGDPVPCIVLDPFAGSGTVGIVAYKLGREFVGIDLAGGDADLGGYTAHDRIDAARDGRPLDEYLGHRDVGQTDLLENL